MASWIDVENAAPELAQKVRARFEAHGLGLLATVRSNGFPRISGIEPMFSDEVWLGMMPRSKKAADLYKNPKLCLHAATADKNVENGDAKLTGLALPVEEETDVSRFRAEFAAHTGMQPPPGPMHLFRVDVSEISHLRPGGDHLLIEWWREADGLHQVKRR